MIQHGQPPYLECSSAGERRLSAFYARLKCYDGKSIEEIYQASKVFIDGSTGLHWKSAKGRSDIKNREVVRNLYSKLWDWYIDENPDLLTIIQNASGLQDKFGQKGHVCQATELWRIRNKINLFEE